MPGLDNKLRGVVDVIAIEDAIFLVLVSFPV